MTCPCGAPTAKPGGKYCGNDHKYEYRVRPTGLKYHLKVQNRAWFGKGQKPHNAGKGKGFIDDHGYRRTIGEKREHIHIVEMILGRELQKDEMVHHVNEKRDDNRQVNLQYFRHRSAHTRLHHFARRTGLSMELLRVDWENLYANPI